MQYSQAITIKFVERLNKKQILFAILTLTCILCIPSSSFKYMYQYMIQEKVSFMISLNQSTNQIYNAFKYASKHIIS